MANFSFSQTRIINGVIKDITTLLPVESVSIGLSDSNVGTISNHEGKFKFTLSGKENSLNFSHLYYKLENYTVKQNETEIEIFLEPKSFVLDEVVINQKPGKILLEDAVAASKAKLEKSLLLTTYYREFINVDNKYTNFSDGIIDYYVKRKSGASDLYVKQSRTFDLKDENASEREKAILSVNLNDVRKAVSNAYNFKMVSQILKSDKYYFGVETKSEAGGSSIDVITIEPKENLEDEFIYEGTITYDSKTKLILDINLRFSPEHKKFNVLHNVIIAKIKFNDIVRRASFKIDGDKYVMIYSQVKSNVYVKFGKKINNTFESLCDITTLNYKEGEFDLDKSKKYKESSLFTNGNKYTEEFWKKYDVILLNDSEQKIINSFK
jgi:hypothetical protein